MYRPTRSIDEVQVGEILAGVGEPSPEEFAHGLPDYRYVVLAGEQRLRGFRSLGRVNCTVISITDSWLELGTHLLPGDGWSAELLVHDIFGRRPGRKFSVVVTGTGRKHPDTGEEVEDMSALLECMAEDAGGREPDVVVFPWSGVVPSDFAGDPCEYGQLVHTIRLDNGVEIHRYTVPGTDYFREGSLDDLASSQPVFADMGVH